MYISYGWPKLLKAIDAGDDEVIVHISVQKFLVVVSTTCIQVWASGQVGLRPLVQLELEELDKVTNVMSSVLKYAISLDE